MENKEGILVGIRTTTLKEIEDKDHFQKHLHEADLFDIGVHKGDSQMARFGNIPKDVPYMFGIGGGLHVLFDVQKDEPVWRTIKWEGDPPDGWDIGSTYFNGSDHCLYIKIANNKDGWVWQKLDDDEEKINWKTGKKEWEYKIYFGPEYRKSVSLNNDLNERGWSSSSVFEDENFTVPENLEYMRLESHRMHDKVIENFIVYDPGRAEIFYAKPRQLDEKMEDRLKSEGWKFVDSNIARAICVRTK